jgi:sulfatase maturation enzyme AslB (radical SAM superfamily)
VSSKWYRDHYLATVKPTSNISFPEYVRNYDYVRDSFAEENTNLWPTLKEWGKKMVYYDLYGAEPLLIAPLLEMLRHNHDIGVSKNQQIHINTNGTVWHDDFNELFGSFQRVEIGISIDGIEEKFEYMRYPAKWDLILENLKKYQELSLKYPNIEISVCITVSLLNVYYVAEFMNFFHQSGIDCSVNIVNSPSYLDMRIVTTEVKKKIIDKLSSSSYPSVLLTQNANSIINFLKLEHHQSQQLMQEFWEYTNKYDDLRNESYAHTFPEFYKILTA